MKKVLLIALCLFALNQAKAQVGLSFLHSEAVSSFGISTNPEKRIWGEGRIDMDVSEFSPEIMGFYNFIRKEDFNLFGGLGYRFKLAEGPVIPAVGFTVKPFEKMRNFAFHAEGAYVSGAVDGDDFLKGAIGFRYFIKKSK
ncbi:hypothetical protein [Roseivirga pacifica]|jgi:hypothetical protein|uniref:hypothetical protein n=1 Tax=Roseivirga pacifica TaxID=1267423 RepID=UPI003BAA74CE